MDRCFLPTALQREQVGCTAIQRSIISSTDAAIIAHPVPESAKK
jgi:hypothetical protein